MTSRVQVWKYQTETTDTVTCKLTGQRYSNPRNTLIQCSANSFKSRVDTGIQDRYTHLQRVPYGAHDRVLSWQSRASQCHRLRADSKLSTFVVTLQMLFLFFARSIDTVGAASGYNSMPPSNSYHLGFLKCASNVIEPLLPVVIRIRICARAFAVMIIGPRRPNINTGGPRASRIYRARDYYVLILLLISSHPT